MNFLEWMAVLGVLLLILALASAFLRWLPITTSLIYLGFGVLIGQLGIGLWEMEFLHIAGWMEHLTEVAVLVSLFVSGLKLRMPLRHPAWKSAYVLAGPVMLACIGGVTLLCHYLFGLSWGVAVLIGAILAPTDPVLASLVQVNDARDSDRLRYGLSGEAGFNDGTAFPFVVFGLMLIAQGQLEADWVSEWALHRLLWAVPAGLLIGFLLGKLVGRVAIYLRARHTDTAMSPNDSLALALIALAYVGAELAGASRGVRRRSRPASRGNCRRRALRDAIRGADQRRRPAPRRRRPGAPRAVAGRSPAGPAEGRRGRVDG